MTWVIKNTEYKKCNAQRWYDLFEWTEYMQNNSSGKIYFLKTTLNRFICIMHQHIYNPEIKYKKYKYTYK